MKNQMCIRYKTGENVIGDYTISTVLTSQLPRKCHYYARNKVINKKVFYRPMPLLKVLAFLDKHFKNVNNNQGDKK